MEITTHAARLPVGRQLLQTLGIAKLNKDCDCPLFVVIVWRELQFPRASNAYRELTQMAQYKRSGRRTVERLREPLSYRRYKIL